MTTAATEDLRTRIRAHIDSEVKILTWIQTDALGEDEQLDVDFTDLDSFTFVQLVLSLEAEHDVELLEELAEFTGKDFDALTDFVAERVLRAAPDSQAAP